MLRKKMDFIKTCAWSIIFGIVNCIAAIGYLALFDDVKISEYLTWALVGLLFGIVVSQLMQRSIRNQSRLARNVVNSVTIFICIAGSFYYAYPYLLVTFYPLVETNRHSICCETPIDYGAAQYESLKLTMDDGVIISGWYVSATRHSESLIILIHGHFNDRRGTALWAKSLINAGYGIFIYDQRGNVNQPV